MKEINRPKNELWDNIRWANVSETGVSVGEDRGEKRVNLFEEIWLKIS